MLEGYTRLPCPHLLPGKAADKTDKNDKKELEKHKDKGSGGGGSSVSQESQMIFHCCQCVSRLSSFFIFFNSLTEIILNYHAAFNTDIS